MYSIDQWNDNIKMKCKYHNFTINVLSYFPPLPFFYMIWSLAVKHSFTFQTPGQTELPENNTDI